MGTPLLEARDVTMRYHEGSADVLALQRVSLQVDEGEFVALIGPSGAGKTTLLSIFAGLETPTSGIVALHGDPHARLLGQAGYMPQRDLLLPWRTALGNAIAGMVAQGMSRAEAMARARALFAEFGLAGFERAWPATLSGGMRQRVAFARTVLASHDLLLLDEPFGALDALTRTGLQRWLANLWVRLGTTCLLVTHDLDEALLLSDRIYVLSPRPGTVRLERVVPLERPRRLEMLTRPEIVAIKAELLSSLLDAETDAATAATGGAA